MIFHVLYIPNTDTFLLKDLVRLRTESLRQKQFVTAVTRHEWLGNCLSMWSTRTSNMNRREPESDWKLKLRYGRLSTPYKHFTVLAEGRMNNANEFKCPVGPAWITMKTWAGDVEESGQMVQVIGEKIGFIITGKIEIYVTEPLKPPRKNPYGYDISFTPFEESIA